LLLVKVESEKKQDTPKIKVLTVGTSTWDRLANGLEGF